MTGEITFFELGVADVDRAVDFYGGLLGWTFTAGPHGGFVVDTGGVPGGVHGGDPGAPPSLFFAVDDLDAAVARVVELGGEVVDLGLDADPESEATFGRFQLCRDDQGSPFGLHQPPA